MPEGIEVRKFSDIIRSNSKNHYITQVNILGGRYNKKAFDGYTYLQEHLPSKIINIKTKGKFIYVELLHETDGTFWLFNTLGLTGGWTVSAENKSQLIDVLHAKYINHDGFVYMYPVILEYISNNKSVEWFKKAIQYINVEFVLDNGIRLYFYDQLSFGTLKIITSQNELDKKLKELGPDIMDSSFEIFQKQITKSTKQQQYIGNTIVNQKIISGIGNYLRSDALYLAKISPFRLTKDITTDELQMLYKCIRALMWGDYNYEFAVVNGIINEDIKIPRDYKRDFLVYRQETTPDGNVVEKKELYEGSQKRYVYWSSIEQS